MVAYLVLGDKTLGFLHIKPRGESCIVDQLNQTASFDGLMACRRLHARIGPFPTTIGLILEMLSNWDGRRLSRMSAVHLQRSSCRPHLTNPTHEAISESFSRRLLFCFTLNLRARFASWHLLQVRSSKKVWSGMRSCLTAHLACSSTKCI